MKYTSLVLDTKSYKDIAVISFKRPKQLNAMNKKMMDEIIFVINKINSDNLIKVAVIQGQKGNFMAGADIKEYANQTSEEFISFQRKGKFLYQAIEEASIPYVAMVDGYALGGGFEIALACDFILASSRAEMGLPEVHLGLVPGGGGTQRLAERIGINKTKEMLFMGQRYSADVLQEWGVVNQVFAPELLFDETIKFCQKITRRSKKAIAELKFLVTASYRPSEFGNRIRYEGDICHNLFLGKEAKSKINKFVKK